MQLDWNCVKNKRLCQTCAQFHLISGKKVLEEWYLVLFIWHFKCWFLWLLSQSEIEVEMWSWVTVEGAVWDWEPSNLIPNMSAAEWQGEQGYPHGGTPKTLQVTSFNDLIPFPWVTNIPSPLSPRACRLHHIIWDGNWWLDGWLSYFPVMRNECLTSWW